MIKRILLAGFSIYGGSPGATTPLPPQCNPARQAFYVMRNRNFLLQKNTACQAVFTALTSGIEILNIVISNKLVGLFVVVVVDGIHLIQQGFPVQSAAGAQGFQRIVIIPKLGIYITKQNHRIFWYHKTWTPFLFLYLLLFTPFTVTRFAMHRNHAFA